jgi:hypothetical protein
MYVPITKPLKDEVFRTIDRLQRAEAATATPHQTLFTEVVRDPVVQANIINLLWAPETDLRARLSKYDQPRTVYVNFKDLEPTENPDGSVSIKETNLRVSVNLEVPCFCGNSSIHLEVPVGIDPRMAEVLRLVKIESEIKTRWENVKQQVLNFLESCKSLNEAVKLWPDIKRYLPADAIEKLERKTERAAKAVEGESDALKALRNIDMDAVNTSTVLARMAGARV